MSCQRIALAFGFIERLKGLFDLDSVARAAQTQIENLGYKSYILARLQLRPGESFKDAVLASTLPSKFVEEYSDRNFVESDPFIPQLIHGNFPVVWRNEILNPGSPAERDLKILRRDLAIDHVCAIPIHGPAGYHGCFAAIGLDHDASSDELSMLHLVAQYTFAAAYSFSAPSDRKFSNLTPRERQVLHWMAQGKSAWEIGKILDISHRTVNEHTQSILAKLNAVKREQAVAIAARERLI
ncbi:MAG TPA: LuxR C-terminal-related transcriptional regulator [Verrucomicrobiae bacterium]|nr:LuxR C-terminal-related transcriptional regulator [Verrucomicrobiae bacterium]